MARALAQKKLVIIDPGHGGLDSGAVGVKKMEEDDINLLLSHLLKERIEKMGYEVEMTRYTEETVGLGKRRDMANRDDRTIAFISLYLNSFTNHDTDGMEVFYNPKSATSAALARGILLALDEVLTIKNRGIKPNPPEWRWFTDIRRPAVLVEVVFISNPNEESLLNTMEYRIKLADAIAEGFRSLFKEAV